MYNQDPINFSKQLIKGRIAEMIFEQMYREADFTVLSFGYENIIPELMHQQHELKAEQTLEIIRRAPDFAVINKNTHDVHLVEVKYRRHMSKETVFRDAKRMYQSWKPSFLFIATPEGFYYDKVSLIVESDGKIAPLVDPDLPPSLQEKYIALLNTFLQNGEL